MKFSKNLENSSNGSLERFYNAYPPGGMADKSKKVDKSINDNMLDSSITNIYPNPLAMGFVQWPYFVKNPIIDRSLIASSLENTQKDKMQKVQKRF